ncbi:hypothetical protein [Nocardia cyriacigeorgica]|uniref:hypothetical protein n=1 Tax=Nocardia cyriacigeorgica TaxID=135487 RepID=UPI001E28FCC9|nr:hypothetical protein [Nocardia cyriacigeorgica]
MGDAGGPQRGRLLFEEIPSRVVGVVLAEQHDLYIGDQLGHIRRLPGEHRVCQQLDGRRVLGEIVGERRRCRCGDRRRGRIHRGAGLLRVDRAARVRGDQEPVEATDCGQGGSMALLGSGGPLLQLDRTVCATDRLPHQPCL